MNVGRFGASLDREAAQIWLAAAQNAPSVHAPREITTLTMAKFNCLGCHQRDELGGASATLIAALSNNQTAQDAEALIKVIDKVQEKIEELALQED